MVFMKRSIILLFLLSSLLAGCTTSISEEKAQELFDYAIRYSPCPVFIKFYVNEMGNKWESDNERNQSASLMVELFDDSYKSDQTVLLPRALTTVVAGTVLSKSESPIESSKVYEAFDVAADRGIDVSDANAVWSAWVTETESWCKPFFDEYP